MDHRCPACDHTLLDLPAPDGVRSCPECGARVPLGLRYTSTALPWPSSLTALLLVCAPPTSLFLLFLALLLESGETIGQGWFGLGTTLAVLGPFLLLLRPQSDVVDTGLQAGETAALALGINLVVCAAAVRAADAIN